MSESQLPKSLEVGGTFAGYAILRRLTDGPSPYFHVRTARGEELALQVVFPGSSAAWQSHAQRVLNTIAKTRHPALCPLNTVAQNADLLFCTTRLPVGGFLVAKVGTPWTAVEEAARLVERIANAVQALHDRRILHRNLSPHAIGLDSAGTPFVMDYTLATPNWTTADFLELQGQIIGRLGYIAPEQAFARRTEIGPATDVYSLGAILYELLTGQASLPAEGGSLAMLGRLDRDDVVPPAQLRHEIPSDLEAICLRCLARRSSERFATAEDLANALRRFLGIELSPARQDPWWLRLWRGLRRAP